MLAIACQKQFFSCAKVDIVLPHRRGSQTNWLRVDELLAGCDSQETILSFRRARYRITNFTVRAVGARNPATAAAPL